MSHNYLALGDEALPSYNYFPSACSLDNPALTTPRNSGSLTSEQVCLPTFASSSSFCTLIFNANRRLGKCCLPDRYSPNGGFGLSLAALVCSNEHADRSEQSKVLISGRSLGGHDVWLWQLLVIMWLIIASLVGWLLIFIHYMSFVGYLLCMSLHIVSRQHLSLIFSTITSAGEREDFESDFFLKVCAHLTKIFKL